MPTTLSASEVHNLKHAPAIDGVLPIFHERWSPRSFSDREVSSVDLKKVFEAARWAPSSYNEQPWRFIVGRRGSETYKKIYSTLVGFNQQWAGTAPVLILSAASSQFAHNQQANLHGLHDLGAASAYLVLQAAALGMAAHQMAGFDQGAARKAFGIPEDFALGSVMALGYQGEPDALKDGRMREMEVAPRQRKNMNEIVFSSWGEPAGLD